MKSEPLTVNQLFQNRRQYCVPFYQRAYVWTLRDQWSALLEPGNVRQLQSVLKVMLALADEGDTLTPDALPEAYRAAPAPLPRGGLQAHDEQLIVDTLARVNGNVSRAAQILGIARSTLYRRAARAGRPRR